LKQEKLDKRAAALRENLRKRKPVKKGEKPKDNDEEKREDD